MTKRALDVVLATALLVAALPIIASLAIAMAVTYRAQPFFVQRRVGRDGKPFRIVKIRTLPPWAPREADKYEIASLHIPRLAARVRRTHLDELPQLFLVLTGRMSLVGPRPELIHLHSRLPADFARARTSVRPGCTGLWQIGRDCVGLIGEATHYDRYYLDNQNWRLDLWVLAQTARQMLSWRPLTLDDVPAWCRRRASAPRVAAASASS